ncbi:cyclin [Calycina marina]|uniref:Cyclin n=1 Tax=Calycina marina TaxID=1763456 RepID=A0A9P7YZL0_9HELO|nr:cyclin [Calycina marina]
MHCGEDDSSPYVSVYPNVPYSYSIASSASSSSASVFSQDDVLSQSSCDSETYECPQVPFISANGLYEQSLPAWPKQKLSVEIPAEQRKHPRRSSSAGCPPPALVRQSERKITFVDSLVDSSAQIVEAIWPLSSIPCRSEIGRNGVLPLRTFIQETLRRSRTSYSTLQVALYYLILVKSHVPEHDFTMEQPCDNTTIRSLQCGRRMFLAALILASKYLQDRNYSARAWSKISGLTTSEINTNEMAFLLAVNWRIHITDAVFQRWTDIVLQYTPQFPPSPGSPCAQQSADWKAIILRLNPELDNIKSLPISVKLSPPTPKGYASIERSPLGYDSNESIPTPKYYTPNILEPSPTTSYPITKVAPALGLLPTPRLIPQSLGFNTPAVSAVSSILGKSSMGYAMAQCNNPAQFSDRWATLSPQSYVSCRRSSLANSMSSISSPESMVSDSSSRSSRSSSISSASGMISAPTSTKLDVQARCRYAKLCSERMNRPMIATVPEFCDGPTSSPELYTGPVDKDIYELSLNTPRQEVECKDEEAARTLQGLRSADSPSRASKRSRPISNNLQENVREMLSNNCVSRTCSDDTVRSREYTSRKRLRCSAETMQVLTQSLHSEFGGIGGPGMWSGILN